MILDDGLAKVYKETLLSLGVPISKEKTMDSLELMEFAKRWFLKGEEISPFPVLALWESRKCPSALSEVLRLSQEKG